MAIQSVKRALGILSLFSPTTSRLSIKEISELMDLPKPTVHGLVKTLFEDGFLMQDDDTRKYSLGLSIYELGTYLSSSLKINQLGATPVQRLAKNIGLMTRIALWDAPMALVTLNLFPDMDTPQFQQLGPKVPAYCTAIGKAVLFTLTEDKLKASFYAFFFDS